MKTKLIILTVISATLVYSCSNDRDEESRIDSAEIVKKSNLKKEIKLNKSGVQSRESEPQSISDTIRVRETNSLSDDPDLNLNPVDGGDPKDVPVPPRR